MKNIITILLLVIFSFSMQAQNKAILKPNGELIHVKGSLQDAIRMKGDAKFVQPVSGSDFSSTVFTDTLYYEDYSPGVNFGIASQDYLAQYFVAPAYINALAVGFLPLEWSGQFGNGNPLAEVKIVKCNWTADEFESYASEGAVRLGYYEADGNLLNPITPFQDDPERTSEWIGFTDSFLIPPFGEDIWSDDGEGFLVPVEHNVWTWIDLSTIEIPEINQGDVFAVVIKNATEYNEEDYSTSTWGCFAGQSAPVVGMKFYGNGRFSEEDYGWWIRPGYNWDFRVAVDVIYVDDWCWITNVTDIGWTHFTTPREIRCYATCYNAIVELRLNYSTDFGETWNFVLMDQESEYWKGYIPGFNYGTTVQYYCSLYSTEGLVDTSNVYTYEIINPSFTDNLLVFNGFNLPSGYPQSYYFGKDDFENYESASWNHDVWAYGPLTQEVLSHYTNVIEITTGGPNDINSDVIREWLESDPNHNYMLAGDEWLGAQTGWEDSVYQPGDFQYDILGITADHNDLVSSSQDSSFMITVEGSTLGDALFNKQLEIDGADSLFYNPNYEIGIANWLDGADFLPDVDVFMQTVFEDSIYNVAGSRELDAGNKIAFFAYDPLSINSLPEYYWFGFSASAPQVEALRWFGIDVVTTTKIETEEIVNQFSLSQNYPNPFNPSTTIEYIIPNSVGDENFRPLRMVKLKVFDVLGREIKTLINKPMQPGKYKVEFDASELSSGVYFYTLQSGEFIQTKKFMLLK